MPMSRSRKNWPACLAALVAGLMLVACADEETGPQFATDPRPTQPPAEAAASPSPALLPTMQPVATPASLTDLLGVRGAVSTVFVALGTDVWSVSSVGEAIRLYEAPDGSTIRALDPAPDAQQVALLVEPDEAEQPTMQVVIVDGAGSVVASTAIPASPQATPTDR